MNSSVRTFQAPSMREALERVKRELGPDAVILGTRTLAGGWPRRAGRPTAGRDHRGAADAAVAGATRTATDRGSASRTERSPPAPAAKAGLSPHLYPYYVQLVQNEVAEELAAQLVQRAAAGVLGGDAAEASTLRNALREYIARHAARGGRGEPPGRFPSAGRAGRAIGRGEDDHGGQAGSTFQAAARTAGGASVARYAPFGGPRAACADTPR